MVNLNCLSFLISNLMDVITNFGATKESALFYKNQVAGMIETGQIGPDDANTVFDLVNFSYITDKTKWNTEINKINYFNRVMDIIITNANVVSVDCIDEKLVNNIINNIIASSGPELQYYQSKAIQVVRNIFGIKTKPVNELRGNSNFGTRGFKALKNNENDDSKPIDWQGGKSRCTKILLNHGVKKPIMDIMAEAGNLDYNIKRLAGDYEDADTFKNIWVRIEFRDNMVPKYHLVRYNDFITGICELNTDSYEYLCKIIDSYKLGLEAEIGRAPYNYVYGTKIEFSVIDTYTSLFDKFVRSCMH